MNLEKLQSISLKGKVHCQNASKPWKWKPCENRLCTVSLQRAQGLVLTSCNPRETPIRATNLTDSNSCICSLTNPTGPKLPRSAAEAVPDRWHTSVTDTSWAAAQERSHHCRHIGERKKIQQDPLVKSPWSYILNEELYCVKAFLIIPSVFINNIKFPASGISFCFNRRRFFVSPSERLCHCSLLLLFTLKSFKWTRHPYPKSAICKPHSHTNQINVTPEMCFLSRHRSLNGWKHEKRMEKSFCFRNTRAVGSVVFTGYLCCPFFS